LLCIGIGVSGGEEGARLGQHHARRFAGDVTARQTHFSGHRREGCRWLAVLRLSW